MHWAEQMVVHLVEQMGGSWVELKAAPTAGPTALTLVGHLVALRAYQTAALMVALKVAWMVLHLVATMDDRSVAK